MKEILNSYILAFDEINALMTISYNTASVEDISARISQIADDLLSLLIKAYKQGIEAISEMLIYELSVDINKMHEAIYTIINGKDFEDRVIDHILADDIAGLLLLADSEYHRVYCTAVDDGAKEYVRAYNRKVEKTWHTLLDDKVRETHFYLEGNTVALGDEFYTYDNDHAQFPGGFTKAENNVNCRCYLIYQVA